MDKKTQITDDMLPQGAPSERVQSVLADTNKVASTGLDGALAKLPSSPVSVNLYNAFASMLNDTLRVLSGGQADFEAPQVGGKDPVAKYPEGFGLPVSAVKVVLDGLDEGKAYRFQVNELATEEGVVSVTERLMGAKSDKQLVAASTADAKQAEAPKKKQEVSDVRG